MEQLKVTLRQHTPLIHFQHYQDGATLRASEVKPQLDRFILTLLGGGDYDAGREVAKTNLWLKGEHPALNYRLRITPVESVCQYDINTPKKKGGQLLRKKDGQINLNNYPLFFANMNANYENPEEYRRFSMTGELRLTLVFAGETARVRSLCEYIKEKQVLPHFLWQTNFGTRTSKGFGSFYISTEDELYVSPAKLSNCTPYWFCVAPDQECYTSLLGRRVSSLTEENEYEILFKAIEVFYKALRSGINDNGGFYFKSLAYQYCTSVLNRTWDKRSIKENFYDIPVERNRVNCDIKDVLGFSTNESWRNQNDTITKKISGKEAPTRMQSPLLFKPIYNDGDGRYYIYLVFNEKVVELDRFLSYKKVQVSSRLKRRSFQLNLPERFRLDEFFDYLFRSSDIDIKTSVEPEFQEHTFYCVLEDIFEQLKRR